MSIPNLTPAPVQLFELPEGASSFKQAGLITQVNMNNAQSNLNKMAKGGKKHHKRRSIKKSHKKYKKYKKSGGGEDNGIGMPKTVVVPQFASSGPAVSPIDANSSSISGNTAAIHGLNNATNDCYATNSCPVLKVGGSKRSKSKRSKRRSTRRKRSSKSSRHKSLRKKK